MQLAVVTALTVGLLLALWLAASRWESRRLERGSRPARPPRVARVLAPVLRRLGAVPTRTRARRARLRATPFPAPLLDVVRRMVPMLGRLPPADQRELLGHAQVLLAEKHFEGAGGLAMTNAVRATIAVQAAFLLLHRETGYFPGLVSVIVYPTAYRAVRDGADAPTGWIAEEAEEIRAGETAERLDAVVLSWDDVRAGAADPEDGENVVLHEFAHQLDFENGAGDGVPGLGDPEAARVWRAMLAAERAVLERVLAAGADTVLGEYAALNDVELFAVAVERFFERPAALRAQHPALYDALSGYFRQDPAEWCVVGRDSAPAR